MIGQTISHYRILSKIGKGGMGEVYLAEDRRLGRKLALKILPEEFTKDPDRVRRFEQEARAASALNHPNIITIHDIGHVSTDEGDLHFIATEFIEGETLRRPMLAGPLDLQQAVDIIIQCCSALQAAHSAGIAHRDIKPENIMLRPDGYIKILDFGLAKLTEQPRAADLGEETPTRSLLETQPGLVMGTVEYMSPEQARGLRIDGRTDIFSLGVVLYEMVSGRRPFNGPTVSDIIAKLLVSEPQSLSEHLPGIPAELERIVARMLAKDPDARYQSAQEIVNDLKRTTSRFDLTSEERSTLAVDALPGGLDTSDSARGDGAPTASLYQTNVAGQSPLTAQPPSGFETNVVQSAQTGWQAGAHPAPMPQTQKSMLRRLLLPSLVGLALLLAAGLVWLRFARQEAKVDSIAVLPFVNLSNVADAEYLSDGIAEGIINTLSQWPELSVVSRNSVIQYKGREVDARAVGRELEVKAVLIGRIDRRGDNLTINAELVDARNGRQIWGERFMRKISDLLSLQDEIARNITGKLQLRLGDAPQQPASALAGTKDSEAYDLYLKGRYYWNLGTPEARAKADEFFEAAVGKDATYAAAAAGCAACHAAGSDGGTPRESMEKARLVANKALSVDDTIIDAHLTLAEVSLRYDWNFAAAESEFKRAIALNPRLPSGHQRYAEFLALMGRRQEAAHELNEARRLDPRSPSVNAAFGTLSYYSRDFKDAAGHLKLAIDLDRNFAPAHRSLGLALEQQGKIQDAVTQFLRAKELMKEDQKNVSGLKHAFDERGRDAFWREYLAQLEKAADDRYIPSTAIAAVQIRLDKHDKAFESLEKAYLEKDGGMVELKVEPVFEPLRSQSKFQDLLRRVGLAQ
jgi:serine/threonine protein kinase/TolB-like protein/Flp pilus assembly protein TadD